MLAFTFGLVRESLQLLHSGAHAGDHEIQRSSAPWPNVRADVTLQRNATLCSSRRLCFCSHRAHAERQGDDPTVIWG
jgi:hypothetical protein